MNLKSYILLFALLLCQSLGAVDHYVGVTAGGGSALMLDNIPQTQPLAGVSAEFGANYLFVQRNFLFLLGLNAEYQQHRLALEDSQLSSSALSSSGSPYTYLCDVHSRSDFSHTVNLQLPIMIGVVYGYFYALGGVKLSYNVFGRAVVNGEYSTFGSSEKFYEQFSEMPNHGFFRDMPIKAKDKIFFGYDARVCVEAGAAFCFRTNNYNNSGKGRKVFVGLFGEYGLRNTHSSQTLGSLLSLQTDPLSLSAVHAYSSREFSDGSLHNLTFGIRARYFFHVSTSESTKKCKCGN